MFYSKTALQICPCWSWSHWRRQKSRWPQTCWVRLSHCAQGTCACGVVTLQHTHARAHTHYLSLFFWWTLASLLSQTLACQPTAHYMCGREVLLRSCPARGAEGACFWPLYPTVSPPVGQFPAIAHPPSALGHRLSREVSWGALGPGWVARGHTETPFLRFGGEILFVSSKV